MVMFSILILPTAPTTNYLASLLPSLQHKSLLHYYVNSHVRFTSRTRTSHTFQQMITILLPNSNWHILEEQIIDKMGKVYSTQFAMDRHLLWKHRSKMCWVLQFRDKHVLSNDSIYIVIQPVPHFYIGRGIQQIFFIFHS